MAYNNALTMALTAIVYLVEYLSTNNGCKSLSSQSLMPTCTQTARPGLAPARALITSGMHRCSGLFAAQSGSSDSRHSACNLRLSLPLWPTFATMGLLAGAQTHTD